MNTLEFRWTVSRGRDTYGYNICTLYVDGHKVTACNGGGYDMKGTSLGNWIASAYADRLNKIKLSQMEEHSHFQRAEKPRRICRNFEKCDLVTEAIKKKKKSEGYLPHDAVKCPRCGEETDIDYNDGKRVSDGRYLYGLTFHDPNFNPGKAVIGKDCNDRTFSGKSAGKTVEQAEKDGDTVGLERYQAFYSASSKVPTKRHTIPLIDGACGTSSVEKIMKAIGLTMRYMPTKSKNQSIYTLIDARENRKAA